MLYFFCGSSFHISKFDTQSYRVGTFLKWTAGATDNEMFFILTLVET